MSSFGSGSERNSSMRRFNAMVASLMACCFCASVPSHAAGSGTPQWAVIGWPGQTGHISPAALSHTVKTKSSDGAPSWENSSQLLLRKPAVSIPCRASAASASGLTTPVGWLPAE
ncbi:hypothetical protein D3C86_1374390 [compost metagenome]